MKKLVATLLTLVALLGPALASSIGKHYFSTNTTNSTLVYGGKGLLTTGLPVNTTATIYYLKLYDKATAPTCGTDTPFWTIPVPASASGNGFPLPLGDGIQFSNGLGFCITGAAADNDTTVAAAGVVVNLGVSGR